MLSPRTLDRLHSLATFLNTAPGPHGGQVLEERLVFGTQIPDVVPAVHEGKNRVRVANAALQRAHDLRGRVAALWADADAGEDVTEQVNALLEEVGALALIATDEGLVYGPASQTSDAVERLTALAALTLADVVAEGEAARLRVCAGEDCGNVLVDASRNRSKRFCDEANCGNRLHVRSYRARQAEAAEDDAVQKSPETPAEHISGDEHKAAKKSKKKKKKDKDKKKSKKKGKKKSKD
ncbi:CGNR zinc finger domain-containing protein [Micrococcus luteus]